MTNGNPETPQQPPSAAPDGAVIAVGYLVVLISIAAAVFFTLSDDIFVISLNVQTEDFKWFALLYIGAQAIERLIEPLMGRVRATEVSSAKAAVASAGGATSKAMAQTKLSQVQADRAAIAWAAASSIALLLCGALGLGILGSLAGVETAPGFSADFFAAVDVVVTGLVIGAGTKPLHDLITRIEKSKNKADPETGP